MIARIFIIIIEKMPFNYCCCLYYRIGTAARRLRYMPEASIIIGIPLSATGKNPNFDREKA